MRLGVNIDHVATLRQARRIDIPDPVHAAVVAEIAGADQITVHLREDRRHIQDRDLALLRRTVHTRLNLEMALSDEIVAVALKTRPDTVTFVPERREEVTTEGGLDAVACSKKLKKTLPLFHAQDIHTSLFIDPSETQVKEAGRVGARAVELHTGRYCEARTEEIRRLELEKIRRAATLGRKLGLRVYAGHGLNYTNVAPVAEIAEIEELNIGHALIGHAVFVGLERAVREMKALMASARKKT